MKNKLFGKSRCVAILEVIHCRVFIQGGFIKLFKRRQILRRLMEWLSDFSTKGRSREQLRAGLPHWLNSKVKCGRNRQFKTTLRYRKRLKNNGNFCGVHFKLMYCLFFTRMKKAKFVVNIFRVPKFILSLSSPCLVSNGDRGFSCLSAGYLSYLRR